MSNLTLNKTLPLEELQNNTINLDYGVNDNVSNPLLNNYVENIIDYIVNTDNNNDINIKKVVENQNNSMSNSVEKVIINPDTLSSTKDHNLLENIILPEDLVTQINSELNQSLMDNLENSIVNNIEESIKNNDDVHTSNSIYPKYSLFSFNDVKELEIMSHQDKNAYQTTFHKKNNSTSNSLLKKVMNGLFFDRNEKSKYSSTPNLLPSKSEGQTTNGLSTLYTFSSPSLNNGLKSPISPSISSPTIDNAVIISSPSNNNNNKNKKFNPAVSSILSSSSSFPFLSFKSKSNPNNFANNVDNKDETGSIKSVSSIQNLKEIKSIMDNQILTSKKKEKGKSIKSTQINDINSSPNYLKGKRSSKIDFHSFLNVFNNLSDAYAKSNSSKNSLDDINSSNSDENLSQQMPSYHSSLSSLNHKYSQNYQNNDPSYMTSLPILSNGDSYVVLPPLINSTSLYNNNKSKNENENNKNYLNGQQNSTSSVFTKNVPSIDSVKMEQNSKLEPKSIKQYISYTKNTSYLSQSLPNKTSFLPKGIQYTSDKSQTKALFIKSRGKRDENRNSLDSSSSSLTSFIMNPSVETIKEEIDENNENTLPTLSSSLPSMSVSKKLFKNPNEDTIINHQTTKFIHDNNRNNDTVSKISLKHSQSLYYKGKQNSSSSKYYGVSIPHKAYTSFLSSTPFTNDNDDDDFNNDIYNEDIESENEFIDHSFIKSTPCLFPSYITAEAEKKINSSKTSMFDSAFIEKVREKTIRHQKSMFLPSSNKKVESYSGEPSSFKSIVPEPEKLRLLNPIYARAQYLEKLQEHDNKPIPLSEIDQEAVSPDQILDTITAEKLRFHLPRRYRNYSSWELIYSLNDHGSSFLTLYDCIIGKGPLLMVIKDTLNHIFGAYIPNSVKISSRFYGSGECFLWCKEDEKNHHSFKVYEWAGLNEFNVLTSHDMIAFGGGKQGRFGLSIDPDLEGGTTAFCDTFKNEPLTISCHENEAKPQTFSTYYYETPNIPFECVNIEFWKIVDQLD
ncbi:TLD-domain-containing protein [Piromyces finnis]|uniref:Oxidation resistance protein 1 n=1 Tax=Piromyces finnis TaxID=1754191 RepID=A0A1Y1VAU5_9FUNG|nr:TLD-domain-containing protein [Piromyces finnis]|eukprot:ORX51482.1 TLD-domain-containing protein [Piromyces finnis]